MVGDDRICVESYFTISIANLCMQYILKNSFHEFLWLNMMRTSLTLWSDLLQETKMYENFMKLIIVGNEMWVCVYKADIKQRSPQRNSESSPKPKKGDRGD